MMRRRRSPASPAPLVLLVEDDLHTREMYAAWLLYSGFRVAAVANGKEAIAKLRRSRPDLIATDIGLEGSMSGFEFCERVKKSERTKDIPVIAVTAWDMGDCVQQARRAGCDLVLVKPCLPETLLTEIQRLLNLPKSS